MGLPFMVEWPVTVISFHYQEVEFSVTDVQVHGGYVLHVGKSEGVLKVGDQVKCSIDEVMSFYNVWKCLLPKGAPNSFCINKLLAANNTCHIETSQLICHTNQCKSIDWFLYERKNWSLIG